MIFSASSSSSRDEFSFHHRCRSADPLRHPKCPVEQQRNVSEGDLSFVRFGSFVGRSTCPRGRGDLRREKSRISQFRRSGHHDVDHILLGHRIDFVDLRGGEEIRSLRTHLGHWSENDRDDHRTSGDENLHSTNPSRPDDHFRQVYLPSSFIVHSENRTDGRNVSSPCRSNSVVPFF